MPPPYENRCVNLSVADFASIARAMEGLELSGSAKIVGEYEKALTTKFGTRSAVAVSSGTVSIFAALWALGIGPGDEVIVAPTAPVMSGLPILQIGATPVFADVTSDPGFGFDPDALRRALSPRTKAILCVPLWGYPIDMDAVMAIANEAKVAVVEDVAQSHGVTWKGRYLGTFGALGCFSTHERKLITTGEGAFLLMDDPELEAKVRVLSRYGIKNNVAGEHLGSNYKLGALPAALGLSQLAKLDAKIAGRKLVGDQIRSGLRSLPLREFSIEPTSVHNGYSLVYEVLDPKIDVDALGARLQAKGVVSDTWRYKYRPMYRMPLFAPYASICAHAEAIIPRTITFPCHEGLSDADVTYIVNLVAQELGAT
jgi:dTDP-4-amino-4,6-dideoxygalactose transaminase